MKTKKFLLPLIFIVLMVAAYVAASVAFCYTSKPEISKGEFPFAITYEYKGETGTISGVVQCEFASSNTIFNQHDRYWMSETIIENPVNPELPNVIDQSEGMVLAIHENIVEGYFMGDPLYCDWYDEYNSGRIEPYIEYYDYVNEISLDDENKDEILEQLGLKIVDFTYAEPIENTFSFSGIQYEADNIPIFVLISFVFLVLCFVFVRKDKQYEYSSVDKLGIVFNFAIGILAIPFITIVCWLYGIYGGEDLFSQIIYNTPPFAIICLALSIVFRRKGLKKTSLIIQFAGIVLFVLLMLADTIL